MVLTAQRKPEGGFHFISVLQLCMVWQAYRTAQIRMLDVRVWFAAQEVVARRCQLRASQQATYTGEELVQLVGRAGGLGTALQRLHTAGVLTWESHTITFPHLPQLGQHAASLHLMLTRIPNSQRRVPVPRRLLRFLAKGCTRAVLATLLGHLFRCLYYRQGYCQPAGFCKASWIAAVFGVSERAVKAARQQLEAMGILLRQDTPQWVRNRYGQKMTLNLCWKGGAVRAAPVPTQGAEMTPLAAVLPSEIAPLDSHRELLSEEKYQNPAAGRPTGVLSALFTQARKLIRTGAELPVDPRPVVSRSRSAPAQAGKRVRTETVPRSSPQPTLLHITLRDLQEPSRLLLLYEQSLRARWSGPSEAERLSFVALAQHVLRYHPANPGGLFLRLLTQRRFAVITQAEEDAARRCLREYLYQSPGCPVKRHAA